MQNERAAAPTRWHRYSLDFNRPAKFTPGIRLAVDKNRVLAPQSDSVVATRMFYEAVSAYLQNADTAHLHFRTEYTGRDDYLPIDGQMKHYLRSHTITSRLTQGRSLTLDATYRLLKYQISELAPAGNTDDNIMGRLLWNRHLWQNNLRFEMTYTAATGREQRREYRYIRALEPGQGTHQWVDYNNNNLQELDEFVEALRPEDRLYVKIFVPVNEFVNAYSNDINTRLNIRLPQNWREKGKWLNRLSRLSGLAGWQSAAKTTGGTALQRFVPAWPQAEEVLLSTRRVLQTSVFYNRADPVYGFGLQHRQSRRRQLLTGGFEENSQRQTDLTGRVNVRRTTGFELLLQQSERRRLSDFLEARNYNIIGHQVAPQVSWQPRSTFRLAGTYSLTQNINQAESGEQSTLNRYMLEIRTSKAGVRNIQATVSYIEVKYEASANTLLAYEMLEALQPGQNYTWNINVQQQLIDGLQLIFSYDGRKVQRPPRHSPSSHAGVGFILIELSLLISIL